MPNLVTFDRQAPPELIIFVDAEEEFDWQTFAPTATSVRNIACQRLAQDIMNEFGVQPTYLVDYPVATQADGFEPLRALARANLCSIGAQLHPWVNRFFFGPLSGRATTAEAVYEKAKAAMQPTAVATAA